MSIPCGRCATPIAAESVNTGGARLCPVCGTPNRVDAFPSFLAPAGADTGAALMIEGEAGCFYHPRRRAVVPCDTCGRFLCSLCDIELGDTHICPSCLEAGRKRQTLRRLIDSRTLYDQLALMTALLSLLIFFLPSGFVAFPLVVFLAIKYWKAEPGIVAKSRFWARFRFLLAVLLSGLSLSGWVAVIIAAVN